MKTTEKTLPANNAELARELYSLTNQWVNTFNFIQIDILTMVAERDNQSLSECIRQQNLGWDDLAEWTGKTVKALKKENSDIEEHEDYQSMKEQKEQENYPMWNTCFEFKEKVYSNVLEAAENAGFGIIEDLGDFNQILFVAGAGYSFYGQHWIPLFLNLPWNTSLKEKYKDVYYRDL